MASPKRDPGPCHSMASLSNTGGLGGDEVFKMYGGTFEGGRSADTVAVMYAGLFNGGASGDAVSEMRDGTFDGGDGVDHIRDCVDSPPAVVVDVENIPSESCTP